MTASRHLGATAGGAESRVSPVDPVLPRPRDASMLRLTTSVALAAGVCLSLFWSMHYLIDSGDRTLESAARGPVLDFVRVKREERVRQRQLKPIKPPAPEQPPPEPPTPRLEQVKPRPDRLPVSAVGVETDIALDGGFNLGFGEGDYLPIVKVAPIYPRRALSRSIEGHCVVQYTVTKLGTVKDVRVVADECSSTLFKDASVRAAQKFKYKPRIIDGVAVEVPGVRNRFKFEIREP